MTVTPPEPTDTRTTTEVVHDLMALVDFGEFTTYADLSEAVFGHRRAGVIGKLAAKAENVHRVVANDNKPSKVDQKWKVLKLRKEGVRYANGWLMDRYRVTVSQLLIREENMLNERERESVQADG